jgi:hypothetical protein
MDRYMIPANNRQGSTGSGSHVALTLRSARRLSRIQVMSSISLTHRPVSLRVLRNTSSARYIRSRAARHNKTPPLDAYKQDDWVLATWQGLSLGRSRPKTLGPCSLAGWRGPFQVVSLDSIRQTVTLRDPTDLLVMKPDVRVSQLRTRG